ncbi:MAG: hypothetical protein OES29_10555 [Desulfuromonadales bacterium]|jgi:hypothetical protein|nr:hypothetical protein [Desulfuromonadales bacterium]MDH3869227.1 hypothetical protein [Desulfuromonadales bacterium]
MTSDEHDTPKPGSIWTQIYRGKSYGEIKQLNRFANRKALNDTADFTETRRKAVNDLFKQGNEISLSEIKKRGNNFGNYAAFRAIAHDVATWVAESQHLIKAK